MAEGKGPHGMFWTERERAETAEARVAELEATIRECLSSSLRAVPKHVLSRRTGVLPLETKEENVD